MGYLPSIDVIFMDEDGIRQPLPNLNVHVYNVTTSAADTDLVTDAYGVLAEGAVTGSAGDIIELSLDDYSLTQRFTLGATQEDAYADNLTSYIGDDLSTDSLVATEIDIFVKENGSEEAWRWVGSGRPGETVIVPYQTSLSKNLLVKGVPKSDAFFRTENALSETGAVGVLVTATRAQFGTIFDHTEDESTTGTGAQDLWVDSIPANTFALVGDEVWIAYRLSYAGNTNDKQSIIYVDSNDVFDTGVLTKNGGSGRVDVQITRDGPDTLKVQTTYHDGLNTFVDHLGLTSVDFSSPIEIKYNATTADAAGDITLLSAKAIFVPAASSTYDITYLGDNVTYGGDQVTYS